MALVQIDEARGGKMSDRTVAALKQVIRLDKDNAQAHFYLGNAADQRGARAEAEQHWRNVIRVLPESSALRRQAEAGLEAVSGDSK